MDPSKVTFLKSRSDGDQSGSGGLTGGKPGRKPVAAAQILDISKTIRIRF